ncbi:hypothetical protein Dsin_033089 [Dipteronia sinensis]|uniref:Uncharacterized protein n=1 Tax=Dipteronia sinensis TaxID=43782 RepID=A0AAD9ZA94_9ROSI|nr:hypothetical protein Dsin_033089 [Dipteronia sinensis]
MGVTLQRPPWRAPFSSGSKEAHFLRYPGVLTSSKQSLQFCFNARIFSKRLIEHTQKSSNSVVVYHLTQRINQITLLYQIPMKMKQKMYPEQP